MRSSSGPGIVSATLAVAMNRTCEQVELDVEVVVAERVVLRRVEHLEQGRARVAAPVGADLVDLVEHDHRVHRPRVAQRAHQAARERADVGAPVAADLGLVADAAERHAHELAAGRAGDRLADRGLAGAGRADQGQDRAGALVLRDAAVGAQLAHGQVLGDAVLDVLEARVVGVEHLTRVHRDRASRRSASTTAPRSASRGRSGSSSASPDCSPMRSRRPSSLSACSRTSSGMPASSILVRYSSTTDGAVLAQLALDRLHLLAQEVLALLLVGAGLDVLADAAAHLQLGQALALELDGELEALGDVERLEDAGPCPRSVTSGE